MTDAGEATWRIGTTSGEYARTWHWVYKGDIRSDHLTAEQAVEIRDALNDLRAAREEAEQLRTELLNVIFAKAEKEQEAEQLRAALRFYADMPPGTYGGPDTARRALTQIEEPPA